MSRYAGLHNSSCKGIFIFASVLDVTTKGLVHHAGVTRLLQSRESSAVEGSSQVHGDMMDTVTCLEAEDAGGWTREFVHDITIMSERT